MTVEKKTRDGVGVPVNARNRKLDLSRSQPHSCAHHVTLTLALLASIFSIRNVPRNDCGDLTMSTGNYQNGLVAAYLRGS